LRNLTRYAHNKAMNSLHSRGNGLAVEGEDRLADGLDFGEALFDREAFPPPTFFAERVFMCREPSGSAHA
jgi:hypothetical protein